jgi:hypothetical protein
MEKEDTNEVVEISDGKVTFRRFSSIENSYSDKFIESIINQGHADNNAQWVALEKSKANDPIIKIK